MAFATRLTFAAAVLAIGGATGGAVIGAEIGATEMLNRSSVGGDIPQFETDGDRGWQRSLRNPESPPDRYAIETPEGRFEVAELRDRGLYRNRRQSAYDAALVAEDRAWEREMAALERGEWQPDPHFAASEWNRAGGASRVHRMDDVIATRAKSTPTNKEYGISFKTAAASSATLPERTPVLKIDPSQVQPLDLPVSVNLPRPEAPGN